MLDKNQTSNLNVMESESELISNFTTNQTR